MVLVPLIEHQLTISVYLQTSFNRHTNINTMKADDSNLETYFKFSNATFVDIARRDRRLRHSGVPLW